MFQKCFVFAGCAVGGMILVVVRAVKYMKTSFQVPDLIIHTTRQTYNTITRLVMPHTAGYQVSVKPARSLQLHAFSQLELWINQRPRSSPSKPDVSLSLAHWVHQTQSYYRPISFSEPWRHKTLIYQWLIWALNQSHQSHCLEFAIFNFNRLWNF